MKTALIAACSWGEKMYEELKNYELKLTIFDLRVINDALLQLPYRIVAPLIDKINAQIVEIQKREKEQEEQEKPT